MSNININITFTRSTLNYVCFFWYLTTQCNLFSLKIVYWIKPYNILKTTKLLSKLQEFEKKYQRKYLNVRSEQFMILRGEQLCDLQSPGIVRMTKSIDYGGLEMWLE